MARHAVVLAAFAALAAMACGEARAQARVEVGVLTCTVRGGSGFIIGSTKDLRCRFNKPGRDEFYHGTISKFGLDIGTTKVCALVGQLGRDDGLSRDEMARRDTQARKAAAQAQVDAYAAGHSAAQE